MSELAEQILFGGQTKAKTVNILIFILKLIINIHIYANLFSQWI